MKDAILCLTGIGCGVIGLVITVLWLRYGLKFYNDELKEQHDQVRPR